MSDVKATYWHRRTRLSHTKKAKLQTMQVHRMITLHLEVVLPIWSSFRVKKVAPSFPVTMPISPRTFRNRKTPQFTSNSKITITRLNQYNLSRPTWTWLPLPPSSPKTNTWRTLLYKSTSIMKLKVSTRPNNPKGRMKRVAIWIRKSKSLPLKMKRKAL